MEIRKYETEVSKESIFYTLSKTIVSSVGRFGAQQTGENILNIVYYSIRQAKNFFVEFTNEKEFQIQSNPSSNAKVAFAFSIIIAIASLFSLFIFLGLQSEVKFIILDIAGILIAGLVFGSGLLIDKLIWRKIEKTLIEKSCCKRINNKTTT